MNGQTTSRRPAMGPWRRRAFTLIEVLIAFSLFTMVSVIIYKVLIQAGRSGTVAAWEGDMMTRLNNMDELFRKFIDSASYPSIVSPQGTVLLNSEAYDIQLGSGVNGQGEAVFEPDAEGKVILTWYRCKQGFDGVPGFQDRPTTGSKVELIFRNLSQTRKTDIPVADLEVVESPLDFGTNIEGFRNGPPGGGAADRKFHVPDVSKVTVRILPKGSDGTGVTLPAQRPVAITLIVEVTERAQGQLTRQKEITATADVGARS